MPLLFFSVLIIASGGLLAIFFSRWFTLMKCIAILGLVVGCGVGMVDSFSRLLHNLPMALTVMGIVPLEFRIDGLSAFFLTLIFGICFLATIYSFHYLEHSQNQLKTAVGYFFFSLLAASMVLVVTAANMLTFVLAWELMSLSSFFLVIQDYQAEENRRAGYLYFIFSHVGAMFIIAAFGLMYHYTGTDTFSASGLTPWAKGLIFILAFIGFGSKAGMFPLHVWLPYAHPAAPSHISAVMSGVMIKTGIYGILRMYQALDPHLPGLGAMVLIVGVVSGVLGVVYALGQQDLKRLLAYSSVENIGIIFIGIGIGMIGVEAKNPLMAVMGFSGGLLHVLNHAIFKSLLFMGAGVVLHKTGTRTIDALGGLMKRMRITGITFLMGSLSISALPPFNGFVSEFFIYLSGFRGIGDELWVFSLSLIAIVGLAVIGGLAIACFTKVVGVAFQGEPRTPAAGSADEKGVTLLLPMALLAAGCAVIGIYPAPFMAMAIQAVSTLGLEYGHIPTAPFIHLSSTITLGAALFMISILIILVIRKMAYRKKSIHRSETWGCGFTRPTPRIQYTGASYCASILDFFRPMAPLEERHRPITGIFPKSAQYHCHVDDIAERHLNRFVVIPVLWLFDRLRWIQHGDIHLYIGYILLAIVGLLFFI